MVVYNDMIDAREKAYAERIPRTDELLASGSLDRLTARREAVEGRYNDVDQHRRRGGARHAAAARAVAAHPGHRGRAGRRAGRRAGHRGPRQAAPDQGRALLGPASRTSATGSTSSAASSRRSTARWPRPTRAGCACSRPARTRRPPPVISPAASRRCSRAWPRCARGWSEPATRRAPCWRTSPCTNSTRRSSAWPTTKCRRASRWHPSMTVPPSRRAPRRAARAAGAPRAAPMQPLRRCPAVSAAASGRCWSPPASRWRWAQPSRRTSAR